VEGISWPTGALSPPPSWTTRGSGDEALEGWSIKVGVLPDAEVEGVTASPTLDLL